MENQNLQNDPPSRDSSISLEDHNGRFPSRSDLYTAHQQQRAAYGPLTEEPFLMMPLDFPSTYSGDDPSAAGEPSDTSAAPSSLSVLRLERYLAEEQCHERLMLGVPILGSNKATVKKYIHEIIHSIDGNDASQAGAIRGTMTDCDDKSSPKSTTSSMSTSSAESSELVEAHDSKYDPRASSDMIPSLAGLGETDMARFKPEQASADSESHNDGPDLGGLEEELEVGRILMRHRTRGHERHDRWRVGKQARVRRNIRRRRRQEEHKKEAA
ncbi:hypothetical protein BBK36DRAFT_1197585 [Trichoderma citrinoviride]|uniref:Uncharacterized protein n=1 Tax=Trichoderma citrinoviride TaxID=58853 RepID=A0A2T4BEQ7_9HYPO|nr:hypothetical protein BBK36DRAFT_1197585 [Trichoderma citrinoviride]PTB67689.1 hypothetical protein BBK36DRAFT_1197585 [Trichoderma citrinoviride]